MSGALAELVLLSVTGIAFGLGAALAVGVAVRLGAARIARVEPRSRARLLTVLGIAPLVLALVGVAACVLPSVVAQLGSSYLGWPGDHCDHHDGHPHLCPFHLPEHGSPIGWLLLLSFAAWAIVRIGGELAAVRRGATLMTSLASLGGAAREAHHEDDGGFAILDTEIVFAAATGLLRPVVWLSRGLILTLPRPELDAVLAHEHAHVRRLDALRITLVRMLWSLVPAALARPLLVELGMACEEACDREAADAVGDPLIVADAIVACTRAARRCPTPELDLHRQSWAMSFGAVLTARRVRRLVDPATDRGPAAVSFLVGLALLTLALAEPLHHAAETLLGLLLH